MTTPPTSEWLVRTLHLLRGMVGICHPWKCERAYVADLSSHRIGAETSFGVDHSRVFTSARSAAVDARVCHGEPSDHFRVDPSRPAGRHDKHVNSGTLMMPLCFRRPNLDHMFLTRRRWRRHSRCGYRWKTTRLAVRLRFRVVVSTLPLLRVWLRWLTGPFWRVRESLSVKRHSDGTPHSPCPRCRRCSSEPSGRCVLACASPRSSVPRSPTSGFPRSVRHGDALHREVAASIPAVSAKPRSVVTLSFTSHIHHISLAIQSTLPAPLGPLVGNTWRPVVRPRLHLLPPPTARPIGCDRRLRWPAARIAQPRFGSRRDLRKMRPRRPRLARRPSGRGCIRRRCARSIRRRRGRPRGSSRAWSARTLTNGRHGGRWSSLLVTHRLVSHPVNGAGGMVHAFVAGGWSPLAFGDRRFPRRSHWRILAGGMCCVFCVGGNDRE